MRNGYQIRAFKNEDQNFILATWLRGLYYGNSVFSDVPKNLFMENFKKIAYGALHNPGIKVRIAYKNEDVDQILGYSISTADDSGLIWIHVKAPYRKLGIGKSLVPVTPKYVTFLTEIGKSLLKSKLPNTYFNPF